MCAPPETCDKDSHTTQWRTIKNITQDASGVLWYQHDTTGGASGAAVYTTTNGNYVIAVNAFEDDPPSDNGGVEMTSTVFNFYNNNR